MPVGTHSCWERHEQERLARVRLRQPLWPHQLEAVASDSVITCIAAARRTGKTTTAEVMAMYTAFSKHGARQHHHHGDLRHHIPKHQAASALTRLVETETAGAEALSVGSSAA